MSTFISIVLFLIVAFASYVIARFYKYWKISNRLNKLLSVQLMLGGAAGIELDPIRDDFISGYIVKFACDFADINRYSNRWGLVYYGLRLTFGTNIFPVSQTEDFANQFDSDDFALGVAMAKIDLLGFINEGKPTLSLANHLRGTYHSK